MGQDGRMVKAQVRQGMLSAIKRHFAALGYSEASQSNSLPKVGDALFFEGKNEVVCVKILGPEAFLDRNTFMRAVLDAGLLLDYCNRLFLAVPLLLLPSVDADTLRAHGMGLIGAGEEELVVAQDAPRREPKPSLAQGINLDDETLRLLEKVPILEARVRELEATVAELRIALSQLRGQFEGLSTKVDRLASLPTVQEQPSQPSRAEAAEASPPAAAASVQEPPQELPSFLQDNPWVEILSKRGEE